FLRDVTLVQAGIDAADECIMHRDRAVDIRRFAKDHSSESIRAGITQALKAREAVDEGFNVKLALTVLKEVI
ncbi:MAG: hypothetical protein HQL19_02545, partial [Candidatus Omnitrophica bacterium]|nr:hypothetical protein [Candidatus Omnitrophota bacterium]